MINKTTLRGIKNIIISKKNRKFEYLLNYLAAFLKLPSSSHPLEIQVEPSAICNLKCKMCNLNKSTLKGKFLTPKKFNDILNKFKPNSVNLTGMGETLLNPHFNDLLKISFQKNIQSSFITNIQLLNNHHLQAIKKYPPISISISMESGYAKKYNQIRRGANFDTTISKIKELQKFIKKNSLKTDVKINIVILDFNLKKTSHIFKIFDIAHDIGIDKVTIQNTHRLSPYIEKLYTTGKINSVFKKFKIYAKDKKINISLPSTKLSNGKCYYPWVYPQITSNGEVLPCCIIPQFGKYDDIVKKYSFGNIIDKTLNKAWNSKKARFFRKNHQQEKYCQTCTKNKGIL